MPGPAGALQVAMRLPKRAAEPAGQFPRGVRGRHACGQQVRRSIDPCREDIATRTTTSHVINVLLNLSHRFVDTPWPLNPPITQQDLEAEIANCVGGVLSPLLANIYLHAFDREMARVHPGVLVRYADDFVVMCRTPGQAEAALETARHILASLGLELHPDKTRVVDLREGREGFDFLGCHFRARMWGRLWEQQRRVRYYLHRWPSQRAMKRLREKVRDRTGANRVGTRVEWVIEDLNPILRGWGNYFRTGNAAKKFVQIDRYVVWRLHRLQVKKRGRNLHAGQADQWTEDWFDEKGLYRLRGTIRYPKAA
jgi:hypothetical protein